MDFGSRRAHLPDTASRRPGRERRKRAVQEGTPARSRTREVVWEVGLPSWLVCSCRRKKRSLASGPLLPAVRSCRLLPPRPPRPPSSTRKHSSIFLFVFSFLFNSLSHTHEASQCTLFVSCFIVHPRPLATGVLKKGNKTRVPQLWQAVYRLRRVLSFRNGTVAWHVNTI